MSFSEISTGNQHFKQQLDHTLSVIVLYTVQKREVAYTFRRYITSTNFMSKINVDF